MSRGDDNLDHLFKDAHSGNEHAFDPTFWEQTKHVYKAPVAVPFYTKPLFIAGAISVMIAGAIWFSVSTPEDNIAENQQDSTTEISITKNNTFEPNNTQKLNQTDNKITTKNNNLSNGIDQVQTADNDYSEPIISSKKLTPTPNSTKDLTSSVSDINSQEVHKTSSVKVIANNESIANQKPTQSGTTNSYYSESSLTQNQPVEGDSKSVKTINQGNNTIATASALGTAPVVTEQNSTQGNSPNGSSILSQSKPIKTAIETNISIKAETEFNLETENTFSLDNQRPNSNQKNFSSFRKEEYSLGFIQTEQNSFLKHTEDELSLSPINETSLKPLNKPFSILLSTGYMWSQNLKTAENRISTSALDKNIELSVEYHFKPHWGAQVGLSYNQTTESHSYNYLSSTDNSFWNYTTREITVEDKTWWLGGWYYYAPYQDSVIDTVWVKQIDTADAQLNAEHIIKTVEIPFLITYTIAVNRWNIQVASGASFGFNAGSTGKVLIDNDNVREESTSKQLFNSVQYNYLLRTQVAYSLTEHWQLSARPQMKMNLNSIYKSNSSQYQKYLFYGVNAGIIYRF